MVLGLRILPLLIHERSQTGQVGRALRSELWSLAEIVSAVHSPGLVLLVVHLSERI